MDDAMITFFAISTMLLFQLGLALFCFYKKQAETVVC
jgi:hypothetical protein